MNSLKYKVCLKSGLKYKIFFFKYWDSIQSRLYKVFLKKVSRLKYKLC